ncbi:50S ribosomal protein L10 [Planctomycetota bacterium]
MSKYVKGLIENELQTTISDKGLREFMIVSIMGVGGVDNNVIRGDLKAKGVEMFVVKNSLFRRALKTQDLGEAVDLFKGPCAVAFGGDSIVDVAKEISDWGKKVKALSIKGAFLDGAILDEVGAQALAKMPTRKELQSQIAATIMSPASKLAGAIGGPASLIAGCVKTLIENAEKEAA